MTKQSALPYAFDVDTLLNESQPRTILAVGDDAIVTLQPYLQQKTFLKQQCRVTEIRDPGTDLREDTGRHDTGVVAGILEQLTKPTGLQLLARMRDLLTRQFCVVVPLTAEGEDEERWQTSDLLALGLSIVNKYETDEGILMMFKYDIATYKKTPDWFNSRDWANPELWDKYRW